MLEPCAVKVASTVLRGEGSGNGAFLPYPVEGGPQHGMASMVRGASYPRRVSTHNRAPTRRHAFFGRWPQGPAVGAAGNPADHHHAVQLSHAGTGDRSALQATEAAAGAAPAVRGVLTVI